MSEERDRPPWLIGRQTHEEMLPQIRAENEAWRRKYGSRLKALDQERAERRAALLAAIERIPDEDDRALIKDALT